MGLGAQKGSPEQLLKDINELSYRFSYDPELKNLSRKNRSELRALLKDINGYIDRLESHMYHRRLGIGNWLGFSFGVASLGIGVVTLPVTIAAIPILGCTIGGALLINEIVGLEGKYQKTLTDEQAYRLLLSISTRIKTELSKRRLFTGTS